jgi:hypothetical protein
MAKKTNIKEQDYLKINTMYHINLHVPTNAVSDAGSLQWNFESRTLQTSNSNRAFLDHREKISQFENFLTKTRNKAQIARSFRIVDYS